MTTSTTHISLARLTASFVILRCRFVSRIMLSGYLAALGSSLVIAQGGPLTPPGAPAPTMRSLQELWDKMSTLETQVTGQQQLINLLQQQNVLLLDNAGITLPWQITTVDSAGFVGQSSSLAFTASGQPAISYYDSSNTALKYAVFNGSTWTATTVDSAGDVGFYTSLAFTHGGQPAIGYRDSGNGDLKYAVFNGSTWMATTVDSTGNVGSFPSLAFTPGGQPAISYYDTSNFDLKYAVFNGSIWTVATVDGTGSVGQYNSLAFTPRRPARHQLLRSNQ